MMKVAWLRNMGWEKWNRNIKPQGKYEKYFSGKCFRFFFSVQIACI